tara:strand:+ start:734 stop:922 length:189 start_codon:yes stop_codon:yes gene_type:complete
MTTSKFHWNQETINHFKLESKSFSKKFVLNNITTFVHNDCDLENGETLEDLIEDLTNQIYNV